MVVPQGCRFAPTLGWD